MSTRMSVSGMVPVRMPANDASTMSMNTTPEAPMSALFGKKNQSTSPVTSAVSAMASRMRLPPKRSSAVGPTTSSMTMLLQ